MKFIPLLLILFYHFFLSPLLKSFMGVRKVCKHTPSCSAFAFQTFRNEPFLKATILTTKRIIACK